VKLGFLSKRHVTEPSFCVSLFIKGLDLRDLKRVWLNAVPASPATDYSTVIVPRALDHSIIRQINISVHKKHSGMDSDYCRGTARRARY